MAIFDPDVEIRRYSSHAWYDRHGNYRQSGWHLDAVGHRYSKHYGLTHVVPTIFCLALCIMLIFSLFRVMKGSEFFGFTQLLKMLENAPAIPTDWIGSVSTNFGETFPYGFQWLGSCIDFFTNAFAATIFTGVAGVNLLTFVLYFISILFVGAY